MRILIIRHGDPDYSIDSLTETGWREAEMLSHRLVKENITAFYCSPLGRAQDTAKPTLQKLGADFEILDWLHEYSAWIDVPYAEKGIENTVQTKCPWNTLPQYWTREPELYTQEWRRHPIYGTEQMTSVYDGVNAGWDALLADYGYVRDGQLYHIAPEADQTATIALFCHLGLGLAIVAQMTRLPLPIVWQSFFLPVSSVTTVLMEKYQPYTDQALARVVSLGDTSHLYAENEPLSWSGLHSPIIEK